LLFCEELHLAPGKLADWKACRQAGHQRSPARSVDAENIDFGWTLNTTRMAPAAAAPIGESRSDHLYGVRYTAWMAARVAIFIYRAAAGEMTAPHPYFA